MLAEVQFRVCAAAETIAVNAPVVRDIETAVEERAVVVHSL